MTFTYNRAPETGPGLRLHLNENTAGCSPAVLDALARLRPTDLALYPDYTAVVARCSGFFGRQPSHFVLTNGMDEGILATCVVALRPGAGPTRPEAVIPVPAFEEYAACTTACGGEVVTVAPGPDLAVAWDDVLAAVRERTRLVLLANPGNPTGLLIPHDAIVRIARALAPGALLFLDEAYIEFADGNDASAYHLLDELPNLIIGRTFSKAYGLAGLRVGALLGAPSVIARIRAVVPPYSLNAVAAVALPAALDDTAFVRWYLAQVRESRALVYDACERHGFPYWRSAANFVLVRVGERAEWLVDRLRARGIHVRNRTRLPGCDGCVRISAGVVEHTHACLSALDAVLASDDGVHPIS